jgi:hypothetical protein
LFCLSLAFFFLLEKRTQEPGFRHLPASPPESPTLLGGVLASSFPHRIVKHHIPAIKDWLPRLCLPDTAIPFLDSTSQRNSRTEKKGREKIKEEKERRSPRYYY